MNSMHVFWCKPVSSSSFQRAAMIGAILIGAVLVILWQKLHKQRSAVQTCDAAVQTCLGNDQMQFNPQHPTKVFITPMGRCVHFSQRCRSLEESKILLEYKVCAMCGSSKVRLPILDRRVESATVHQSNLDRSVESAAVQQ